MRYKDLKGNIYGQLLVLEYSHTRLKKPYWLCRCECGIEQLIVSCYLESGRKTSCGCATISKKTINLVGKTFGKLTVIERSKERKLDRVTWLCSCDCGNTTLVASNCLKNGNVTSCGCMWRQRPKGELSHAWKGGVYIDNYSIRTSAIYKHWRKSILERDNFTCKICNSTSSLEVHHISNFHKHVDLRFEEKNSITLCKNCHTTFHSKFGNKDNSYFQLVLFFKETNKHVRCI